MKNTTALLFASNMFGRLDDKIIRRINKFFKRPTFETWEDIHCIIIDRKGRMKTIWNAVNDIDPFFPRYGRSTDVKGRVLREWEQIPTTKQVIDAINNCVFKKVTSSN